MVVVNVKIAEGKEVFDAQNAVVLEDVGSVEEQAKSCVRIVMVMAKLEIQIILNQDIVVRLSFINVNSVTEQDMWFVHIVLPLGCERPQGFSILNHRMQVDLENVQSVKVQDS
jgi:hypothetical protein